MFLDNTVPGTLKERGMLTWGSQEGEEQNCPIYDLPFGMEAIRRWKWTRFIPFSPTFRGFTMSYDEKDGPVTNEFSSGQTNGQENGETNRAYQNGRDETSTYPL